MKNKSSAMFAAACVALVCAMPATAQTLDRIKETAFIKLGYLDDARPFSFASSAGKPEGYSIDVCNYIVGELKKELALPNLISEYAPVAVDFRLFAIDNARIDLLCSPTSVTLAKRKEASFSIPVFAGGVRAVMMRDAAVKLRAALEADAKAQKATPVWRGSPASRVLKGMTFAVVTGTTSEKWLEGRRQALKVDAKIEPVADYHTACDCCRSARSTRSLATARRSSRPSIPRPARTSRSSTGSSRASRMHSDWRKAMTTSARRSTAP